MALSQKRRIALYELFLPQGGEDVTEAFLAEFPTNDGDELVTKTFLRAELGELRTELAELRTEMAELGGGLRAEMHQLHNRTVGTLVGAMGVMTAVLAVLN